MSDDFVRVETEIAGMTLILETGQVARQAHGSVIATLGETKAFAAVAVGPGREDQDFFPLTVDYREKTEAAGKIPGGFFKREGRPTTKEILTMRLIDRAIRPMFPEGFKQEVQVMSHALCYDGDEQPRRPRDDRGLRGACASAGVPFDGDAGRRAHRPPRRAAASRSRPTSAGARNRASTSSSPATRDGIAMVEAGGARALRGGDDRRARARPAT